MLFCITNIHYILSIKSLNKLMKRKTHTHIVTYIRCIWMERMLLMVLVNIILETPLVITIYRKKRRKCLIVMQVVEIVRHSKMRLGLHAEFCINLFNFIFFVCLKDIWIVKRKRNVETYRKKKLFVFNPYGNWMVCMFVTIVLRYSVFMVLLLHIIHNKI